MGLRAKKILLGNLAFVGIVGLCLGALHHTERIGRRLASDSLQSGAVPTSSEFEKFFALRNTAPRFPFADLLIQLSEGDARFDERMKSSLLLHGFYVQVPDGRSLQRKKADFKDPREVALLMSFGSRPGLNSALQGQLDQDIELGYLGPPPIFIGHAPKAEQLEVISWNPSDRHYDFLIVENYAQGTPPKIKKANREICLSCHQGGGPIFARGNWSEINQFNPEIGARIVAENPKNALATEAPKAFSTAVFGFDNILRKAVRYQQSAEACSAVCKDDLECRRQILRAGLLRQSILGRTFGKPWAEREHFKAALQAKLSTLWPKDGFAYVTSVIPDRTPSTLNGEPAKGLHLVIQDERKFMKSAEATADEPYEFHAFIDELTRGVPVEYHESFSSSFLVSPEEDGGKLVSTLAENDTTINPTTARPKVSEVLASDAADYIIKMGSRCLGLYPVDLKRLAEYEPSQIDQVLSGASAQTLLQTWPPSRERIMAVVLAALEGRPEPQATSNATSPATLNNSSVQPIVATKDRTLNHFRNYCARCHAGPDAVIDFGVNLLSDLKNYRGEDGQSPLERIKAGEMPPGQSRWTLDRKEQWKKDREEMIQDLEGP